MEAAVAEVSFASDLPRLEGKPLAASAPEAALEAAADHAGAVLSLAPESLLPVPPAEEDNDSEPRCGDEPIILSEALQAGQPAGEPAECPEGPEEELPEAEAAPAAAAAEPLEAAAEPVEPAGPLPAREVGPRVHSTPALLKKIEPMDWFKLRLEMLIASKLRWTKTKHE